MRYLNFSKNFTATENFYFKSLFEVKNLYRYLFVIIKE